MFRSNRDFYPTPGAVIDAMLGGIDLKGKTVLEPSAGKGDLIDACTRWGAKKVLAFEKDHNLKSVIEGKAQFLGFDFLKCTKQQVSHVDYIIMNPPFSKGEEHILHAWKVAPEGCQIIALCNSETVKNQYSRGRRELQAIIQNYGDATVDLEDCFSQAERATNVEVSLLKLFKPIRSKTFNYEGFFLDAEEESHGEGIMRYNEIRALVGRYVNAIRCFDEFQLVAERMNELVKPIGLVDGFEYKFGYNKAVTTKSEFMKELQKKAWEWVFAKMEMGKFLTSGVMEDINRFVETQSKYPFTMKNIYRMLEIIIGTREQVMERAMVESFDKITRHYHGNRYAVEGWKTNSHYLVKEKFILPRVVEVGVNGKLQFTYNGNKEKIDDLHKALCFLTGTQPVDPERKDRNGKPLAFQDLSSWKRGRIIEFHEWYDWGFFEIKGFQKGTLHCKFKDDRVWGDYNRRVAEIKGFPLPEKI